MKPSFAACADELRKLAGISDEVGRLRPGDVILSSTGRREPTGETAIGIRKTKSLEGGLRNLMHSPYIHAAMYVGDGRVIDADLPQVAESPISIFDESNVKVFRPQLPASDRRAAVEKVEDAVGTKYSIPTAVRAWAASHVKALRPAGRKEVVGGVICSNLIANAYSGKLNPRKHPDLVLPTDLMTSSKLKPIMTVRAEP